MMENWTLTPNDRLGGLRAYSEPSPLPNATGYLASAAGDGLEYRFPAGLLAPFRFLTADFLLDGDRLAVLQIQLQEGEDGPALGFSFGLLNHCQARLRMPLEAVHQNTWMYPREGALLKPLVWGQRVDLARVDRLRLTLYRSGDRPVTWFMTDLAAVLDEPSLLETPALPAGPLLDELGQSLLIDWPGRTAGEQELVERLRDQHRESAQRRWPVRFSRWGGWLDRRWQATGFFRTALEEGRWWLVDPDGHPFWSTGLDCVDMNADTAIDGIESALSWLPPPGGPFDPAYQSGYGGQRAFNYLEANFIRAFGAEHRERWAEIALGLLREWGFNTVANWSDWRIASRAGFPYVRPLRETFRRSRLVYRSFPDVYDPLFQEDAREFAQQLSETAADPAMIGYFLMNEPTWGFSSELLAEGMLFNTPECASRQSLAGFLREKYQTDLAFSAAWGVSAGLDRVAGGEWSERASEAGRSDLAEFSTRMVERFFAALSQACKAVDPNHLNLGARYYTVPPDWVARGMRGFDVFSMNCYRQEVPAEELGRIHELLGLPTLIGEWHFGALDAGLPGSGIGHVTDQAARGRAYRFYLENAAAIPWCVGVHYFTLYDQSALGRFDGENYNIGFLDVCNRPYEPLAAAARRAHERLYQVASGRLSPFRRRPKYLPMLFL
jgi:hypothetical protein